MKKYIFLSLFLITLFFAQSGAIFGATTFTRNLRLGTEGADVLELQKFLNVTSDTRVAITGNGSPGSETTYFGIRTQNAVMRFQEKYKSEVLTPAGLTRGSGFVGEFTRNKLNNLQKEYSTTVPGTVQTPTLPVQIIPPTQVTPPVVSTDTTPRIDSIFPTSGVDGTVITIHGSNFSLTSNTLVTGWGTFENVSSSDGKTITLTVNSGISEIGKPYRLPYVYHLYVRVGKQISNDGLFTLLLEPGKEYVSQETKDRYNQGAKEFLRQKGFSIN